MTKEELEKQKLKVEIEQFQKPFWKNPTLIISFLTVIISATIGFSSYFTKVNQDNITKIEELQELTKKAGSAFNNSGINIVDKTEAEMAQFKSSADSDMHLVSERIGLTKKKEDKDAFLNRKYRYIGHVVVEHKFKDKTKVVRQYLDKQDLNNADKEALCKTMMGYIIRT